MRNLLNLLRNLPNRIIKSRNNRALAILMAIPAAILLPLAASLGIDASIIEGLLLATVSTSIVSLFSYIGRAIGKFSIAWHRTERTLLNKLTEVESIPLITAPHPAPFLVSVSSDEYYPAKNKEGYAILFSILIGMLLAKLFLMLSSGGSLGWLVNLLSDNFLSESMFCLVTAGSLASLTSRIVRITDQNKQERLASPFYRYMVIAAVIIGLIVSGALIALGVFSSVLATLIGVIAITSTFASCASHIGKVIDSFRQKTVTKETIATMVGIALGIVLAATLLVFSAPAALPVLAIATIAALGKAGAVVGIVMIFAFCISTCSGIFERIGTLLNEFISPKPPKILKSCSNDGGPPPPPPPAAQTNSPRPLTTPLSLSDDTAPTATIYKDLIVMLSYKTTSELQRLRSKPTSNIRRTVSSSFDDFPKKNGFEEIIPRRVKSSGNLQSLGSKISEEDFKDAFTIPEIDTTTSPKDEITSNSNVSDPFSEWQKSKGNANGSSFKTSKHLTTFSNSPKPTPASLDVTELTKSGETSDSDNEDEFLLNSKEEWSNTF